MSTVYCPKCKAPRTDRTGHCRRCGQWAPSDKAYYTVGELLLSVVVAAMITIVYAAVVYESWPKWVEKFGGGNRDAVQADMAAMRVAVVIGASVFTLSCVLAVVAFRAARPQSTGRAVSVGVPLAAEQHVPHRQPQDS